MKSSCVALVLVLCSANSESLSIVSDSAWPLTCPDKGSSWNQTACPTTATCCQNGFSGSKYGCCPYPNAVCCNEYMCCPSGTECTSAGGSSYNEIFNCTVKKAKFADGVCTCKPGVPLPVSATKKNVLIIGDSLTIGYTPYVNTALADIAVVQHAPWDTSDGGAEETAYGLQCIAQWLASPSGIPIVADVVVRQLCWHGASKYTIGNYRVGLYRLFMHSCCCPPLFGFAACASFSILILGCTMDLWVTRP